MRWARDREHDAVRHVLGRQGLDAFIHAPRGFAIAVKAHEAELGLDEPGGDLRDPDRLAVELEPQRPGDRTHRVLGGGVAGAAFVRLETRDGADVHDVPAPGLAEQR